MISQPTTTDAAIPSCDLKPSILGIPANALRSSRSRLANRLTFEDHGKAPAAIHARVPMVTPEQRQLQRENAEADVKFCRASPICTMSRSRITKLWPLRLSARLPRTRRRLRGDSQKSRQSIGLYRWRRRSISIRKRSARCLAASPGAKQPSSFDVQDAEIWQLSPGIIAISILPRRFSRRDFLQPRSQRCISLLHIISKFLPLETGARWVGKKAPCACLPFL